MKTKIIQIWKKHKKKILIAGLLALVIAALGPELSLAANGTPDPGAAAPPTTPAADGASDAPTSSSALNETYKGAAAVVTMIIKILQSLLWPILLLIGGLLKNDILFGSGMEDRMYLIWTNIRDIVNILFVLVLLGIALYNVLGLQNQNYQLKTIIPKFVIALIAVNFSFLAAKVAIDAVNVLTVAIFAMPDSVEQGLSKNELGQMDFQKNICEGFYGSDEKYQSRVNKAGESALCSSTGKTLTDKGIAIFDRFDGSNAAVMMAINFMKISEINKVTAIDPSLEDLAVNMIISTILYIVYATAFVALFVILLIRLVVIWVTIVLSPLMVLQFVLPDSIKSSLGGGDLTTKFVKTIIVPIPIALVMTIGYIMMKALSVAQFDSATLNASTLSVDLLSSGIGTLQSLIIAVGTAAIVWVGVFESANGTYAEKATQGISNMVGRAGKFVGMSWKYIPGIPVMGKQYSLAAVQKAAEGIPRAREQKAYDKAKELMGKAGYGSGVHEGKELAKAKDMKEAKQQFYAAGDNVRTADFQKGLAAFLAKHPNHHGDFSTHLGEMRTKDGKGKIKSIADLQRELEKGNVHEDSMRHLQRVFAGTLSDEDKKKAEEAKQERDKKAKEKGVEEEKKPEEKPQKYDDDEADRVTNKKGFGVLATAVGTSEAELSGTKIGEESAQKAYEDIDDLDKKLQEIGERFGRAADDTERESIRIEFEEALGGNVSDEDKKKMGKAYLIDPYQRVGGVKEYGEREYAGVTDDLGPGAKRKDEVRAEKPKAKAAKGKGGGGGGKMTGTGASGDPIVGSAAQVAAASGGKYKAKDLSSGEMVIIGGKNYQVR